MELVRGQEAGVIMRFNRYVDMLEVSGFPVAVMNCRDAIGRDCRLFLAMIVGERGTPDD